MKGLIIGACFLLLAGPCLAKADISRDVLRDQEIVIGEDVVNTGVINEDGNVILIDTTVNQIVI